MKFTVNRSHLSNGLSQVLNVVGFKSTMPILANVLIEASDGFVTLTTTNLDLGVRCKIVADVSRSGAVTLPVRRLASIVKELPALDVCFDCDTRSRLKLSSGGSVFNISGISKDEFPPLPIFNEGTSLVLSQAELGEMLQSVAFAQSTDETRYILNAVYFKFDDGKLSLVATDGRRLAMISKRVDGTNQKNGTLLLPAKAVSELGRLLGSGTNVKVCYDDRKASFLIDTDKEEGLKEGIYLHSKVIEGAYPNYSQVIPKDKHHTIKINRIVLLECVKRAALMTSEKSNSVKLSFSKGMLEISAKGPDIGEALEVLPITYDGPEVAVAFNPAFVTAPLSALNKDEVSFEFTNALSPGVFKTSDSFLCVIMPVRLN